MDKTLVEWLQFLATSAAWGIVSTYAVQVIKKLWPECVDSLALVISVVAAVVIGTIAQALIPFVSGLDVVLQTAILWIASKLWYEFTKWLDFNPNPPEP